MGTRKATKRGTAPVSKAVAEPAAEPAAPSQRQLYEEAILAFHARDFGRAKPLFEAAAEGGNREMAHSARLHARMCEHRIRTAQPEPESAEERYDLAIALINRGEFADAERQLRRAIEHGFEADHLLYALALCCGRQGDIEGAHRNLERAIELDPRNRARARADGDFADLVRHPRIAALLSPGR